MRSPFVEQAGLMLRVLPHPASAPEAEACLRGLVRLGYTGGKLSSGQRKALLAFGANVKLTPTQVHFVFQTEKEAAYRRARTALGARESSEV